MPRDKMLKLMSAWHRRRPHRFSIVSLFPAIIIQYSVNKVIKQCLRRRVSTASGSKPRLCQ
jgi:hypothetical protein